MDKNIVILGAGFGGLHTAMKLGKASKEKNLKNYNIILIDRNEYHTYTPTLYEISTTSKEVANYIDLQSVNTFPIKTLLQNLPVDFMCADISKIDSKKGVVHLKNGRRIPYSYLVVALGSETNFFEIKGLKENSLELKSFHDAVMIRDRIWTAVSSAKSTSKIDIVIGGGGSTGVELASEIGSWLKQLKETGKACKTSITLIDAKPRTLSRFSKKVSKKAKNRLDRIGVQVLPNSRIESVTRKKVNLQNKKEVPYTILVWAGGTKANKIIQTLPFKKDKGRIEVHKNLVCQPENTNLRIYGRIFAIGDNICIYNPKKNAPYPAVARAAISQANTAASNIIREIHGQKTINFHPTNYPYIIPIGGKYAIARIGPITISGLAGWLLKGLVEINYLFSIMPNRKAFKVWIKGLFIFIRNDRLG